MSDHRDASPGRGIRLFRLLGGGIITGAADDDPSAIGTYAAVGAKYGLAFLWIAPVLLPMMFGVTYISAKLGRIYGKGLFAAIRDRFSAKLLYPVLLGTLAGNVIEAAVDLGGVGASLNLILPVPIPLLVAVIAAIVYALQVFGSYALLRNVFKWLALALFAFVGAAVMAKPGLLAVLRNTFVPHVRFDAGFLSLIVACIGTSLSAYVYTWQSNQEVEDQIADGRVTHLQRMGASRRELQRTRRDVTAGMIFSSVILYFIILSTGATLHKAGHTEIATAADAAAALQPLAGAAAKYLFAFGVIGVGFMAVPVMTAGAAYDLVQAFGGRTSLHDRPSEAKLFYGTIAVVTVIAVGLNFLGFNPMKALVWSGIVQGFSVPPLLFLMMLMTNDRTLMGERRNTWPINVLGWFTVAMTTLAAVALVVTAV